MPATFLSAPGVPAHVTGGLGQGRSTNSAAAKSRDDARLRKAAGEFESMLLNSLWKSMKRTFTDENDKDFDPTLESFDDWGMQAMSNAVGNAGGLGIKNLILQHLEPKALSAGGAPAERM